MDVVLVPDVGVDSLLDDEEPGGDAQAKAQAFIAEYELERRQAHDDVWQLIINCLVPDVAGALHDDACG